MYVRCRILPPMLDTIAHEHPPNVWHVNYENYVNRT